MGPRTVPALCARAGPVLARGEGAERVLKLEESVCLSMLLNVAE